jgi:hypothetical protein
MTLILTGLESKEGEMEWNGNHFKKGDAAIFPG